ncbi:hypothetical protein OIU78_006448 [Salix suchowensis]|nr:hypothetical protein OIU78_006448 [Salix suchowensis]
MEQAQYWLWMKRKQLLKSQLEAATSDSRLNGSWEEKAFAEDASGNLGGCIWPARYYSCSFCKREFRFSAFSTHEKFSDHSFVSPFSSYFEQEQHKGYPYDHSLANDSESKPGAEKNQGKVDSTSSRHDNFIASDLFMGLSSAINSQISLSSPGSCVNYEASSCREPQTNVSVLSLLIKPRSNDGYIQSEAVGPNSSSKEDIDLELRLGEPPKVK